MQYLLPVTATTKLTGSPAQYFQYSSHHSPSGSHVFHGEIMYTYSTTIWTPPKYAVFVPYITGQYRIPQNSVKTYEIPRKWEILRLSSKFRVLQKTVVGKLWSLVSIGQLRNRRNWQILMPEAHMSVIDFMCLTDYSYVKPMHDISTQGLSTTYHTAQNFVVNPHQLFCCSATFVHSKKRLRSTMEDGWFSALTLLVCESDIIIIIYFAQTQKIQTNLPLW